MDFGLDTARSDPRSHTERAQGACWRILGRSYREIEDEPGQIGRAKGRIAQKGDFGGGQRSCEVDWKSFLGSFHVTDTLYQLSGPSKPS